MEEVYCPRCKKPLGFPFLKCPGCHWYAMGNQIKQRKDLAEEYIQNDIENESQDRFVLDMVLSEIQKREEMESDRKIKEYENLSKYTFSRYMIINVVLVLLPVVGLIIGIFDGPSDVSFIFEEPVLGLLIWLGISSFAIGINTIAFFMARTKLFFMNR